jgi:hypothetical protein
MNTIACPNCGAQVSEDATFCDHCGSPLVGQQLVADPTSEERRCPRCGASVRATDAFCSNCGVSLAAHPPQVATPTADEVEGRIVTSGATFSPATCPNCGSAVQPGDRFCDNCGHELAPSSGFPQTPQIPAESPAEAGAPSANLYLLVQPAGIALPLPPDKDIYVIGREDPASGSYPEIDLVPYGGEDGGVSRRHAQITRTGGQYFIEDLNSVNYTFVNRQKIAAGSPHPLRDGDEIRLGRVLLRFKIGEGPSTAGKTAGY